MDRRRYVQTVGIAGVALVAGCVEEEASDSSGNNTSSADTEDSPTGEEGDQPDSEQQDDQPSEDGEDGDNTEETGTESTDQVSANVDLTAATGRANSNGDAVEELTLVVMRTIGSDDIDLSETTINYVASTETAMLSYADGDYDIRPIKAEDDSDLVLSADADRYEITIPLTEIDAVDPLSPGAAVLLSITLESGATREVRLTAPDTLEPNSTVTVMR